MKLALALLIPSLIFLTPLSLFAQGSPGAGREALVQTAFNQMPTVVDFLVASYDFHQKLGEAERKQLYAIERITSALASSEIYRRSPLPPDLERVIPRADQLPRIEFSADAKIFNLHPDQPERSAVTSHVLADPIYFNLRYLNSAASAPDYLDVLQTVFHEMGRKTSKGETQTAMDTLAAEMVKFLTPYYQKKVFGNGVKIETLSLPMSFGGNPIGFRMPPKTMLLVQKDGFVVAHLLDIYREIRGYGQFMPSPSGSGNISEVTSVRITNLDGKEFPGNAWNFDATFDLVINSKVILSDPNITMRNTSITFGDSFSQIMIPEVKNYDLSEPFNTHVKGSVRISVPQEEHFTQHLMPRLDGWDYKDLSTANRVLNVERKSDLFRVQISNPQNIRTVFLRVQSPEGALLIPGTATPSGSQEKTLYQFSLPKSLSSSTGKIRITDLILNGEGRIPVPEVLELPVAISQKSSRLSLKEVTVFNGTSWVPYRGDTIIETPEGPLRFRIQVENAEALSQIRLLWNKGSSLYFSKIENVFGTHGSIEEEMIQKFKLVEKADNTSTYEFSSEDVLRMRLPKTAEPTIGSFDSGRRLLKELTVTSEDIQSSKWNFSPYLKIFTREFLKVIPRHTPVFRTCRKAHSS